jgi:hypothetical protein
MLRGLMMRLSGGLFGLRSFLRAMTAITVGCTDISLGASETSIPALALVRVVPIPVASRCSKRAPVNQLSWPKLRGTA